MLKVKNNNSCRYAFLSCASIADYNNPEFLFSSWQKPGIAGVGRHCGAEE